MASSAMEEAKKLLYEKVIKKFTLQEITRHKDLGPKNLIELISKYPGHGLGFKVRHKDWPEDTFYHIKKVKLLVRQYYLYMLFIFIVTQTWEN